MKISFNAFNNSFYQTNNVQAKKSPQVCASLSKDLFLKNHLEIAFSGSMVDVCDSDELIKRLEDNGKIEGKDYLSDLDDKSLRGTYKHVVILDGGIPRTVYNFDSENLKLAIKEKFKYPTPDDQSEELQNENHPDIKDFQSALDYVVKNACGMEAICVKKNQGYFVNTFDFSTQKLITSREYGPDGSLIYFNKH